MHTLRWILNLWVLVSWCGISTSSCVLHQFCTFLRKNFQQRRLESSLTEAFQNLFSEVLGLTWEISPYRLFKVSNVKGTAAGSGIPCFWRLPQPGGSCLHLTKENLASYHLSCCLEFLITECVVIKDPLAWYILNMQWDFYKCSEMEQEDLRATALFRLCQFAWLRPFVSVLYIDHLKWLAESWKWRHRLSSRQADVA